MLWLFGLLLGRLKVGPPVLVGWASAEPVVVVVLVVVIDVVAVGCFLAFFLGRYL